MTDTQTAAAIESPIVTAAESPPTPRTAKATETVYEVWDRRAAETPAKRAKAVRVVRMGLRLGLIAPEDLGLGASPAGAIS